MFHNIRNIYRYINFASKSERILLVIANPQAKTSKNVLDVLRE